MKHVFDVLLPCPENILVQIHLCEAECTCSLQGHKTMVGNLGRLDRSDGAAHISELASRSSQVGVCMCGVMVSLRRCLFVMITAALLQEASASDYDFAGLHSCFPSDYMRVAAPCDRECHLAR